MWDGVKGILAVIRLEAILRISARQAAPGNSCQGCQGGGGGVGGGIDLLEVFPTHMTRAVLGDSLNNRALSLG